MKVITHQGAAMLRQAWQYPGRVSLPDTIQAYTPPIQAGRLKPAPGNQRPTTGLLNPLWLLCQGMCRLHMHGDTYQCARSLLADERYQIDERYVLTEAGDRPTLAAQEDTQHQQTALVPYARGTDECQGYIFAWTTVYIFWYHSMVKTSGHQLGFFYMFLLLLQGSLFRTRIHITRNLMITQEMMVVISIRNASRLRIKTMDAVSILEK